jgi:phosphoglycolate phosphatase-like HAD superfamily hydrolase
VPLAIFDLDNTLVDRAGAFRRWAVEFVARHGLDPAERRWLVAADEDGFAPRPAFLTNGTVPPEVWLPPLTARLRERRIPHGYSYSSVVYTPDEQPGSGGGAVG